MRTASIGRAVVAGVLALTACTAGAPSDRIDNHPRPHAARPNFVVVLTDDLSTDLVRYLPHVTALEQVGATFTNYFAADSPCCRSRSSILTGRFHHDVTAAPGLAGVLHHAGYRTGLVGRYLDGYRPGRRQPKGWDEWDVVTAGRGEYDYDLDENGTTTHYGSGPGSYLTDVLSTKATAFIAAAARDRRPFALTVSTEAPHLHARPARRDVGTFPGLTAPRTGAFGRLPTAPPRWLARRAPLTGNALVRIDAQYERRVESVQAVDRLIADVQRSLRRAALTADTYLVFSSDNGFHAGQYRLLPGAQTAFDTDIRVPMVVSGPAVRHATTIDALGSGVDLAATLEQLAGVRTAATDGFSLAGLLGGAPVPVDWRRAVLVEHVHRRGSGGRNGTSPPSYAAMRTAGSLYVEYDDGDGEYYDLTRDPDELHNLVATLSSAQRADLHARLTALRTCRGAAQCQAAARRG